MFLYTVKYNEFESDIQNNNLLFEIHPKCQKYISGNPHFRNVSQQIEHIFKNSFSFFFFEPHILTTSRPHTRLGYSWLQGVSKFTAFYIVVPVSLQNLYKQLFESNPCNCMPACELCCVPLTVSIRCYLSASCLLALANCVCAYAV